jgi:imidazolonepropionase-like amidohydrolase
MFAYGPELAEQSGLLVAGPGLRFAFVGGTLVDVSGQPPLAHSVVLVEDGRIAAIGNQTDTAIPADAQVVDTSGKWLMPGLIDCHIHLNGEQTLDMYRRYLTPSPDVKLLYALRHANMALMSGFTTVRDVGLGYAVALKRARADGLIACPRILAANSAISTTGGHGDWAIFPYEWAKAMELRANVVDGVDECRLAVRKAFREGADLIKVMISSGGITNHAQNLAAHVEFSPEELDAIVDETHRRGARVAAHSVGEAAIPFTVEAGVDTVEHGVFEPDAAVLAKMAEKGISLVPTLFIFRWVADDGLQAGVFAEGVEAAKKLVDKQHRLVKAAREAGVNIALGTDNNGVLGPERSAREIQYLCDAGLTTIEALQAATRNAAAACGLDDRLGTLAVGKWADMLILEADPLADPRCLQDARTIHRIVQSYAT